MTYLRKLLFFIMLTVGTIANAADYESTYIQKAVEVTSHINTDKNIWPGFKIGATVVYFPNTQHSYAINFTPTNRHWEKRIINNNPVYFLPTDEYQLAGFNPNKEFSFLIDKKPVSIELVKKDNSLEYIRETIDALVKKSFDFYLLPNFFTNEQINKGDIGGGACPPDVAFTGNGRQGTKNSLNVTLLILEAKELAQYLNTANEDALKNYLAVDQQRTESLNSRCDQEQERNDILYNGVADYIAKRSTSSSDDEIKKELLDSFKWMITEQLPPNQLYHLEIIGLYIFDDFIGPIVAYALDKTDPQWKTKIMLSKGKISAVDLLKAHYSMGKNGVNVRVEATKQKYDFNTLFQYVDRVPKNPEN